MVQACTDRSVLNNLLNLNTKVQDTVASKLDYSGLYYKRFRIVIYNHKGTLQFAAYLTIVIYAPS
jgi:hypothetical protein